MQAARLNQIPRFNQFLRSVLCVTVFIFYCTVFRYMRHMYLVECIFFFFPFYFAYICNVFIAALNCDTWSCIRYNSITTRLKFTRGKFVTSVKSRLLFESICHIVDTAFILIIRPKGVLCMEKLARIQYSPGQIIPGVCQHRLISRDAIKYSRQIPHTAALIRC